VKLRASRTQKTIPSPSNVFREGEGIDVEITRQRPALREAGAEAPSVKFLFIAAAAVLLSVSPVLAQSILGGSIPMSALGAMPSGPGFPVSDAATQMNTYIIAISVATGGVAGGFDPNLELAGDLEQEVSGAGGLPLMVAALNQYTTFWPGFANASYNQSPTPGSPEGNTAVTLGTLQGALVAGANQQATQPAELQRLEQLELENATAAGVLQALEVGNEIGIFASEQDMKLRNATNAQLNALMVAESNRQNQKAQDELESLAIVGQHSDWNLGDGAMNEQDPQIPNE